MLAHYRDQIATIGTLRWIGYLSTVGVYGDQGGRWVDETTPTKPNSERTAARVEAEAAWLRLGEEIGVPTHVFRLAGIYGPGRSAFDKLIAGTARRIKKDGQVFSRIHVEDIGNVLEASIANRDAGAIYNVADDEPAAPDAVVAYAAKLLGVAPPPEVDFADADLSPMARSFYEGSRRIANTRIKSELGVKLRYPTYREGLAVTHLFALTLSISAATVASRRYKSSGRDWRWSAPLMRVSSTSPQHRRSTRSSAWPQGTSGSHMPCRMRTGRSR